MRKAARENTNIQAKETAREQPSRFKEKAGQTTRLEFRKKFLPSQF
jgi:hypothetical protein